MPLTLCIGVVAGHLLVGHLGIGVVATVAGAVADGRPITSATMSLLTFAIARLLGVGGARIITRHCMFFQAELSATTSKNQC